MHIINKMITRERMQIKKKVSEKMVTLRFSGDCATPACCGVALAPPPPRLGRASCRGALDDVGDVDCDVISEADEDVVADEPATLLPCHNHC